MPRDVREWTANELLRDMLIRQRRWLVNVENGLSLQVLRQLQRLEQELAGKIVTLLASEDPQTWLTGARQARILADMQVSINEMFARAQDGVEATISEAAKAEADVLRSRLAVALAKLPEAMPIYSVPQKMLAEVVQNYLPQNPAAGAKPVIDRLSGLSAAAGKRVQRVFADAVARGDGAEAVARAVRRAIGPKSITAHEATVLARTQLQRVANDVSRTFYHQNRDIVTKVQVLETLDKRTCLQCAQLHGRVFPIDEAPVHPLHPQCRGFTTPVVGSWRALGIPPDKATPEIRRLFDGKPAPVQGYEDWLRGQSDAVQRQVLGASRFDEWSKGKAELADFATDRRVLTVEEYRRRAAA